MALHRLLCLSSVHVLLVQFHVLELAESDTILRYVLCDQLGFCPKIFAQATYHSAVTGLKGGKE